jgi:hypothetical protein
MREKLSDAAQGQPHRSGRGDPDARGGSPSPGARRFQRADQGSGGAPSGARCGPAAG